MKGKYKHTEVSLKGFGNYRCLPRLEESKYIWTNGKDSATCVHIHLLSFNRERHLWLSTCFGEASLCLRVPFIWRSLHFFQYQFSLSFPVLVLSILRYFPFPNVPIISTAGCFSPPLIPDSINLASARKIIINLSQRMLPITSFINLLFQFT